MTLRRVRHRDLEWGMAKVLGETANGPRCYLCIDPISNEPKVVDSEEHVEGVPGRDGFFRVLVKCHGAEELVRFDSMSESTEWDYTDMKAAMQRFRFFDPLRAVGAGEDVIVKKGGLG